MNSSLLTSPRKLLGIITVILIVFLGIMSLLALRDTAHWMENMRGALAVAFVAIILPASLVIIPFFQDWANRQSLSATRLYSWLWWLAATIFLNFKAYMTWNIETVANEYVYLPITILALLLVYAIYSKSHWLKLLDPASEMKALDERENSILTQASHTTMAVSYIAPLVLIAVLSFFPAPSKNALFELLFGVFTLQLAIRNFIAWRMGLR